MSLFKPSPKTLRALRSVAAELDQASQLSVQTESHLGFTIEPSAIRNSTVESDRPHHRLAVAASLGALVLVASFASVAMRSTPKSIASNDLPINPGTGSPYVFPAYIPEGLCLAEHSTKVRTPTSGLALSLQSKSGGSIEVYGTSWMSPGYARQALPLVGEELTINTKRAFRSRAWAGQTLVWSLNTFDFSAESFRTTRKELIDVAKHITVSADKNSLAYSGSQFKTIDSEQQATTEMVIAFGACRSDKTSETDGQRLVLVANQLRYVSPAILAGSTREIQTVNRTVGPSIQVGHDGSRAYGFTDSYVWSEGTTMYFVGHQGLTASTAERFLSQLMPSTKATIDSLANDPGFSGQVIDSVSLTGEKPGKQRVRIRDADYVVNTLVGESKTKLCVTVDVRLDYCEILSGGSLQPEMNQPPRSRFTPLTWTVVADSSIVRAEATFPDGHVEDLPSVVDQRAPTLRVFVWAQKDTDPRPVSIRYLGAGGDLIHEQTTPK